MSLATIPELEEIKAAILEAIKAVAINQEYTIGRRTFRRADLPELRKTLVMMDAELSRLKNGMSPGPQKIDTRIAR